MVDFGARLRALRKQKDLTQQQLAERVGMKNSVISFYEVGERVPSPRVIVRLAAVLGVSTDYLLGVSCNNTIDITGLDSEDVVIVQSLVDDLRRKNQRI